MSEELDAGFLGWRVITLSAEFAQERIDRVSLLGMERLGLGLHHIGDEAVSSLRERLIRI